MADINKDNMQYMTADMVRQLFDYRPETGDLTSKHAWGNRRVGTIIPAARRHVRVENRIYTVSRLCWLHFYGEWPQGLVDHKDRNPSNNRINNLRDVTHTQNQQNKAPMNIHGYKGITWRNRINNPWLAKIRVNGKRINLGSFPTKEAAAEAYKQACLKYHGDYACTDTTPFTGVV